MGKWTVIVKDTVVNEFSGEFTDWRLTLWGPVLAQGLIVAHLLAVTLRVLGRPNPWLLLPVAFGLSLLTGLPWFTAQLIPDVFTGVVVLAVWLLGFNASSLSAGERLWLLLPTQCLLPLLLHLPPRSRPVARRRSKRRRRMPKLAVHCVHGDASRTTAYQHWL